MKSVNEAKRQGSIILMVGRPEEAHAWSVRWLDGERDMSKTKDERLAALQAHLQRMKDLEKKVKPLVPDLIPESEGTAAAYWIAEAEIWLAKEKTK